jgi:hypothetical protein
MRISHYSSSFIIALPSFANANNKYNDTSSVNDSIRTSTITHLKNPTTNISEAESKSDDSVENELLGPEKLSYQNLNSRKALFHFLKSEKLKKESRDKKNCGQVVFKACKSFCAHEIVPCCHAILF